MSQGVEFRGPVYCCPNARLHRKTRPDHAEQDHAEGNDGNSRKALCGIIRHGTFSEDARKEGKLLPRRDLWHALLFYTTGETVAEAVAKGCPSGRPYTTSPGLWERSWLGYPQIFEKEWKPWMQGERGFDESVQRVVAAVLASALR